MIRDVLNEYKELTNEILNTEDVEYIYELVMKRDEKINLLKSINAKKEEIAKLLEELDIIDLEKSVGIKLCKIKEGIKVEIDNLHKAKYANNQYQSNQNTFNIFSAKI